MRHILISGFFLLVIILSCSRVYNPDIEAVEQPIVVEGLITDEPGPYYVRISRGIPFDNTPIKPVDSRRTLVSQAQVEITDDSGNSYSFTERDTGIYSSNRSEFTGIAGRSYILHIITNDGEIYESTPQLLLPKKLADGFYVRIIQEEYLFTSLLLEKHFWAYEPFVNINNSDAIYAGFRFTSKVVLIDEPPAPVDSEKFTYCWRTFIPPGEIINITGVEDNINSKIIRQHVICTFPIDSFLSWNFRPAKYQTLLIVKQYNLNNETHQYYRRMYQQFSAEGKLFEPTVTQISGNLSCTTNPKKLILGFFEVSSLSKYAYIVSISGLNSTKVNIPDISIGCTSAPVDSVP